MAGSSHGYTSRASVSVELVKLQSDLRDLERATAEALHEQFGPAVDASLREQELSA